MCKSIVLKKFSMFPLWNKTVTCGCRKVTGRLVKGEVSLAQAASDAGFFFVFSPLLMCFLAALVVFVFDSSMACSSVNIRLCASDVICFFAKMIFR